MTGLLRPLVRPQQVGQSLASDRLACPVGKKGKQSACFLRDFPQPAIAILDHQRPENADRQRHRNRPNILLAATTEGGYEVTIQLQARSVLNHPEAGPGYDIPLFPGTL